MNNRSKRFNYILIIFIIILLSNICYAKVYKIIFGWVANTEEDLAGYRLYTRKTRQLYPDIPIIDNISKDVTSCQYTTEDIISTNYFVLRSFDTSYNESSNSNELRLTPDYISPEIPNGFEILEIYIITD